MGAAHCGKLQIKQARTLQFGTASEQAEAKAARFLFCLGCDARCMETEEDSDEPPESARATRLEALVRELFAVQDLDSNGLLEESELIDLNLWIGLLHYGSDLDRSALRMKYRELFRDHLDPSGAPVPYFIFRRYILQVLEEYDNDAVAQEMILEQFIAEASLARNIYRRDVTQRCLSRDPKLQIESFERTCQV
eukprot:TRINITY_DN22394_c0_g1_i1.p1 TRINITY_DN22394_c0_g1~~TRINITY_DN22394_c0_g1_i1.p1  ORF type:complete len:217 (-),score=38.35 TRINITY_DN22394_c0_g1_i1:118-699(-)